MLLSTGNTPDRKSGNVGSSPTYSTMQVLSCLIFKINNQIMFNFTCPICHKSTNHNYKYLYSHSCDDRQALFTLCKDSKCGTQATILYTKYWLEIFPYDENYLISINLNNGDQIDISIPFLEIWPPTEDYIDSLVLIS